jgi:methionyl-tRNA formyltransferase
MAGDAETGVTIMRVVLALDAGPMVSSRARPIGPDETSVEVERDLAGLGADLLVAAVDDLAAGRATETPQDDRRATYAPRLTRDDGVIDWRRPAPDLHNQVRGLHPWPHAFTFLTGARYLIHRTAVGDAAARGEPGAVLEAAGDALVVGTGGPSPLRILELQPEGKRVLHAREFLAGRHIPPGARFDAGPTPG